jgi:hypothetical protein
LGGGGERRAERDGDGDEREGICAGAGFAWLCVHVRRGPDETY